MKNVIYIFISTVCFLKLIGSILFLKEMIESKELVSLFFIALKKDIEKAFGIKQNQEFTEEISSAFKRISMNFISDSFYKNVILIERKLIKLIYSNLFQ